jgi:hypothetical protein
MSVGRGWATNAMFMSYITGLPVDLLMAHAGYKTSGGTQPYVLPRATSPAPHEELLKLVLPQADAWATRFKQVTLVLNHNFNLCNRLFFIT